MTYKFKFRGIVMEIDTIYDIKSESQKKNCTKHTLYFQSRKLYRNFIRFYSKKLSNNIYLKTCNIDEKDRSLSSKSVCISRLFYYSEIILGIKVFKEYIDLFNKQRRYKL